MVFPFPAPGPVIDAFDEFPLCRQAQSVTPDAGVDQILDVPEARVVKERLSSGKLGVPGLIRRHRWVTAVPNGIGDADDSIPVWREHSRFRVGCTVRTGRATGNWITLC